MCTLNKAVFSVKCSNVMFFVTPRHLGPPPVPTSWGSACPSSSSWGTGSSTLWPEMRSRRSACRGLSRLMARSAPTLPTLLDLWVSQGHNKHLDFKCLVNWYCSNIAPHGLCPSAWPDWYKILVALYDYINVELYARLNICPRSH